MTENPVTSLTVIDMDASQPGTVIITLSENLHCTGCGRTGPIWQVILGPASETPTSATPTTNQAREMRAEDPGG